MPIPTSALFTRCVSTGSVDVSVACACVTEVPESFCVCVAGVCVVVGGFFLMASPWASVAFLWIGFDGWLFGGLILLGPPAMGLREPFLSLD